MDDESKLLPFQHQPPTPCHSPAPPTPGVWRRRCSSEWACEDDARPRVTACRHFALPDSDFCECCARYAITEGEVLGGLHCPWCREYGDFSPVLESPLLDMALHEEAYHPARAVKCGGCGLESLVLEVRVALRLQRALTAEESARTVAVDERRVALLTQKESTAPPRGPPRGGEKPPPRGPPRAA